MKLLLKVLLIKIFKWMNELDERYKLNKIQMNKDYQLSIIY